MVQTIPPLVVGMIAGAAVVLALPRGGDRAERIPPLSSLDPPSPTIAPATRAGAEAAADDDPDEIAASIEAALAAPASLARDVELRALLGRLVELDGDRAVRLVQAFGIDARLVQATFRAWAERDAESALSRLIGLEPKTLRCTAALGTVQALGADARGIERVAAHLPADDLTALQIGILLQRAERDLGAALRSAMTMTPADNAARTSAIERLAEHAAAVDPLGALAAGEAIDADGLRQSFRWRVVETWAVTDPAALLAHLRAEPNFELSNAVIPAAWEALARFDAVGVLALHENPGSDDSTRSILERGPRAALEVLVQTNAGAAAAYVEELPPGQSKNLLLQTIARGWARENPDAAWAWATQLDPPSPSALQQIVSVVAKTDVDRTVGFLLDESIESNGGAWPMILMFAFGSEDFGRLAAGIAMQGRRADRLMTNLMSTWSRQEPDVALDWVLTNAALLDSDMPFRGFATVGSTDPEFAARTAERLPPDLQALWLAEVGRWLAESAPSEALSLVSGLGGQPAYEAALAAVIEGYAGATPSDAARMFDEAPPAVQAETAAPVARAWAAENGIDAAAWVDSLGDTSVRATAVGEVARAWSRSDPTSAREWVLPMLPGPSRDAGLRGLLLTDAADGSIDARLIAEFGSDATRQDAVSIAAGQIARFDADTARAMIDRYLTEPQLRRRAQSQLEAALQRAESVGSNASARP